MPKPRLTAEQIMKVVRDAEASGVQIRALGRQ